MSAQPNTTPKPRLLLYETNEPCDLEKPDLATKPKALNNYPSNLYEPEGQFHIHTALYRGSFNDVQSSAIRAAGLGSNVLITQFLKGGVQQGPQGCIELCGKLHWLRPDYPGYLSEPPEPEETLERTNSSGFKAVNEIWQICKKHLLEGDLDHLVLDELGLAVSLGYLREKEVVSTLEQRPTTMDIILTGPSIPKKVMQMADQVTEFLSSH